MNFKKIPEIKVGGFFIFEDNLITLQNEDNITFLKQYSCNDLSLKWKKESLDYLIKIGKITGVFNSQNTYQIYNSNNGELINTFSDINILFNDNDDIIIYDRVSRNVRKITLSGEPIWRTSFRFGHLNVVSENYIYTIKYLDKANIYCFNANIGEQEWHFSLSNHGRWYNEFDKKWEEGEVCHFVGVVDDILWVDVTAHVLLGIDIHTGQIKYNLKEANPMNEFPEKFTVYKPHYGKTNYDQEHHKLWGMEGYSYWEVDLNEAILNLKLWYIGDECESHFTSLPNFDICGINQDYIFFPMGGLGGNRKAQVAALNRKTMKIDWQYLFTSDTPYYTPTKVEVSEDHLFVLDSEGTLNIFEKEKVA